MKTDIYLRNISLNSFRIRNVSDNGCRETQNTHFMFNIFFPEIRAVYEIMWKNMA